MVDAREVATWIRPDIHAMPSYTPIVPFEVLSQRLGVPAELFSRSST